jgi:hypothetical protein
MTAVDPHGASAFSPPLRNERHNGKRYGAAAGAVLVASGGAIAVAAMMALSRLF